MKTVSVLIIMASLSFKLNAFDKTKIKEVEEFIKNVKSETQKNPSYYNYKFEGQDEVQNKPPCFHCPRYLDLTEKVNQVVERMSKDLKNSPAELPVKINKLKFMYYTQAMRERDGNIRCMKFKELSSDFRPDTYDGQFKLMAEDVLKFSAVTDIQYMNPEAEETVYYYRGEGDEKNLIIQAILTKNGGKFRYYRYFPTEAEDNPYNLPSLERGFANQTEKAPAKEKEKENPETNNNINFKIEVEKRNKYIPKNIHLVKANVDQELLGNVKVQGSSDLSVKGNEAHLALIREGSDLLLVDMETKLNGKTEHKITVPFEMRVSDQFSAVQGRVETGNAGQIMNLSLVDHGIEVFRSEIKRNADSKNTSYVLARDVALAKNEAMSMQYGRGEDSKQYVALKHAKTLGDNVTLVLDVRVDQDKKATLMYQVSAKF